MVSEPLELVNPWIQSYKFGLLFATPDMFSNIYTPVLAYCGRCNLLRMQSPSIGYRLCFVHLWVFLWHPRHWNLQKIPALFKKEHLVLSQNVKSACGAENYCRCSPLGKSEIGWSTNDINIIGSTAELKGVVFILPQHFAKKWFITQQFTKTLIDLF